MNATSHTTHPFADTSEHARLRPRARGEGVLGAHLVALGAILGLSAAMNIYELQRNAWANNFYSAGVKSMLLSLHNFLFISFDPGGLITLDKPPLAVWLQAVSAKVFGFTPLALLLPEAIAGVLAVGVLYLAVERSFGRTAGLLAALCLAVFPALVAVSRDNNPDALLILLMTVACWLGIKAIENGRLLSLIATAVAVGLAFNTKALAAYLVVPGIAVAYLVCAPGPLRARFGKLILAGVVMAAVSIAWMAFVDLTPARHRPYVGGSLTNSELGLTFEYNGLGRIDGQVGGPGSIPARRGADAPLSPPMRQAKQIAERHLERTLAEGVIGPVGVVARHLPYRVPTLEDILGPPGHRRPPSTPEILENGRKSKITAFGKAPGPLRLLEEALGGQGGWLLPLSLGGLIAAAALIAGGWRRRVIGRSPQRLDDDAGRRDPRLAGLIVLGGWFLVEALVLSLAKGIVHPYYTSALGPGACAMVGAGIVAFGSLIERSRAWVALLALAVLATVITQIALLEYNEYMQWLPAILLACCTAGVLAAAVVRRAALASISAVLAALLIAPAAWSAATWGAPVEGTFPVAGPRGAPGYGGVGVEPKELPMYRHLVRYLHRHHQTARFGVLTVSSVTAAPMILMGERAAALGGYSGTDPALTAGDLAHLVEDHQARYVLLGGPYSSRGGNAATAATIRACRFIRSRVWGGVRISPFSIVLYDCAGRAQQLWDQR